MVRKRGFGSPQKEIGIEFAPSFASRDGHQQPWVQGFGLLRSRIAHQPWAPQVCTACRPDPAQNLLRAPTYILFGVSQR